MTMIDDQTHSATQVYILRLTAVSADGDGLSLRTYILEDPFSKARRGFADLEELAAFLAAIPPARQLKER